VLKLTKKYQIIGLLSIAMVWLLSGLFCKLLNFEPRHLQIVSRILGADYATLFTQIIGILEIGMAIWIVSCIVPKLCAMAQIILVLAMNVIEIIVTPDLLLFGRWNIIPALLFVSIVYYYQFIWLRKINTTHVSLS
jgi:DoxX-like family